MRYRKLRIAWSVGWGICLRAACRVLGAKFLVLGRLLAKADQLGICSWHFLRRSNDFLV